MTVSERALALGSYRCPDHGCDLEEVEEHDEHGVLVVYVCPVGPHHFGSAHDAGWYYPVEEDV